MIIDSIERCVAAEPTNVRRRVHHLAELCMDITAKGERRLCILPSEYHQAWTRFRDERPRLVRGWELASIYTQAAGAQPRWEQQPHGVGRTERIERRSRLRGTETGVAQREKELQYGGARPPDNQGNGVLECLRSTVISRSAAGGERCFQSTDHLQSRLAWI